MWQEIIGDSMRCAWKQCGGVIVLKSAVYHETGWELRCLLCDRPLGFDERVEEARMTNSKLYRNWKTYKTEPNRLKYTP